MECKLLSRPNWSDVLTALKQAEENGEPGEIPIAVMKKARGDFEDTVVVLRLEIFVRLMEEIRKAEILCPTTNVAT